MLYKVKIHFRDMKYIITQVYNSSFCLHTDFERGSLGIVDVLPIFPSTNTLNPC